MTLSDQIIEHGPFAEPLRFGHFGDNDDLTDHRALDELREELIAAKHSATRFAALAAQVARQFEARQQFTVEPWAVRDDAEIRLRCARCGTWQPGCDDEPLTLAELNQRADEHAEVCGG